MRHRDELDDFVDDLKIEMFPDFSADHADLGQLLRGGHI